MTEHESGEVLRPPQKSAPQLVEELTERFAIELVNDNSDHRQYQSTYLLPQDSLGMIDTGQADVTFEKFVDLEPNGSVIDITHTINIGCDRDVVFTVRLSDGELAGGYGESGLNTDETFDPDEVHPFLTKLSAHMWLHERGLDSPELDEGTVVETVVATVKSLAHKPADQDYPDGDAFDTYPLEPGESVWTALKAERWWVSEDKALCRLSLMDGDTEIIDLCVEEATNNLTVSNYSGAEFEGDEAFRRAHILFGVLAEAIASGQITLEDN